MPRRNIWSKTVSIISAFLVFFKENITRVMTCLVTKIDYFQVRSMIQSIFSFAMSRGRSFSVVRRLEDKAHRM